MRVLFERVSALLQVLGELLDRMTFIGDGMLV